MAKKLILCDCLGSQAVDVAAISEASGMACSKLYTNLCEEPNRSGRKRDYTGRRDHCMSARASKV